MATIKQDAKGLYAWVGGYAARPIAPTRFNVGDKVKCMHFGGSTRAGMGKLPGKGQYEEMWDTNCHITENDIDVGSFVEIAYPRTKVTIKEFRKTNLDYAGFRYNEMLVQLPDGTEHWVKIYKIYLIHKK